MTISAYPLQWPEGWTRTPAHRREKGSFSVSMARARDGLFAEISRLGGRHVVLSTNLKLRQDGIPYATQPQIDDHGIAVYFDYKKRQMCFACDRYTRFEANMRAIELTIAALRGIERWGASDMLDRAFTGFTALPGPESKAWHIVLGCPAHASTEHVTQNYKRARSEFHPDKGGDAETFGAVLSAWKEFCAERGLTP